MNFSRWFACVAMVLLPFATSAADVNRCTDANGRVVMTDRPCGDPSERRAPPPGEVRNAVEQMDVEDMFAARNKVRDNGKPVDDEAPEPTKPVAR